jgi:hypothetical protein
VSPVPQPFSQRPWSARESGVLIFEPSAEADQAAPAAVARRPWHRIQNCVVIYDADGKPVSSVQNAAFLFHVEQCHDPLKDALAQLAADFRLAAMLAGFGEAMISDALAAARAALAKAGITVAP